MNKRPAAFWRILAKVTGILPALLFFKPKVLTLPGASRRLGKPCILMSNHTSLMDFPLYFLIFWRYRLRFLMAEVLYRSGFLGWLLDRLGGIRVDREAFGVGFVRACVAALDRGDVVGVFPQGRLPVKGQKFPYKPGIIWIAMQTRAPIVPVYTDGHYGLFKRTHVIIGEPFFLPGQGSGARPGPEETAALCAMLEEKEEALRCELERRLLK